MKLLSLQLVSQQWFLSVENLGPGTATMRCCCWVRKASGHWSCGQRGQDMSTGGLSLFDVAEISLSLADRGRKWKEDEELNNRSYTWSQMERVNLCRRLMVLYSKLWGNFIWNFFTTVNIVCAISYFYFMWEKNSPSMAQHFTATITADFIDQRCVSMLALAVMPFFCETLWALQPLSHTDTHKTFKFSYLLFNFLPI